MDFDLKAFKDQQPKIGSKVRGVNGKVIGHIAAVHIPGSIQTWGIKPLETAKKNKKKVEA